MNKNDLYNQNTKLNLLTLVTLTRAEQKIHQKEYLTIKNKGITVTQFGVLEALYHKGDMKICDIIDRILTTSGNITVVIKNLEEEGLVTKYVDQNDKRGIYIRITQAGMDIIENIFPKHLDNINEIFNILTDDEKSTLVNILNKFIKQYNYITN